MSERREAGAELEAAMQSQVPQSLAGLCEDLAFTLAEMGRHWEVWSRALAWSNFCFKIIIAAAL